MEDDLLEESWLFDGALDGVGGLGGGDGLSDDRLLALLPPLPSDPLYDGLEGAGPGAGAPGAAGARRSSEGGARAAGEDTSRAALLRELDDGGGWRCLNRGHPEDCSRCGGCAPRPARRTAHAFSGEGFDARLRAQLPAGAGARRRRRLGPRRRQERQVRHARARAAATPAPQRQSYCAVRARFAGACDTPAARPSHGARTPPLTRPRGPTR